MSLTDYFSPDDLLGWVYISITVLFSVLYFRQERHARIEQRRLLTGIQQQLNALVRNNALPYPPGRATVEPADERAAASVSRTTTWKQ